jgi:alpha-beta hydrolase superfamily lysophospholipase
VKTVDGIDLEAWYVPASAPPPRATIALFHGYASSKASWLSEANALHAMGCAVILVDFRGSGGSSGGVTTLGYSESADVAATCDLADRLIPDRPLILYGRSMGSVAVLRAVAVAGVRPAGIVLECPFDRLLGTVRHRFSAMGLPAFPCAELLVFWGGVQHGMNGFAHNPVEYAASVTCPALFMHGTADSRVSVAEAKAVFDALGGDKSFEVFTDLAHESYFSARPEAWRKYVTEFLDALTTSTAEE